MRRLENYVRKYGRVVGPKLFHALQSQAAHAGVGARLRRKIDAIEGRVAAPAMVRPEFLPLFPEQAFAARDVQSDIATTELVACG